MDSQSPNLVFKDGQILDFDFCSTQCITKGMQGYQGAVYIPWGALTYNCTCQVLTF